MDTWKDYFCDLLNHNTDHMLQTTAHPIEPIHLNASEAFSHEEVRQAIYMPMAMPGFDKMKSLYIPVSTSCSPSSTIASSMERSLMHGSKLLSNLSPNPTLPPNPPQITGISLQSFVAKTYCQIINSRLRDWLERNNNALSDKQNSFRSDRCCQEHTFVLTPIIENRMAKKEDTFTCFIDFKMSITTSITKGSVQRCCLLC